MSSDPISCICVDLLLVFIQRNGGYIISGSLPELRIIDHSLPFQVIALEKPRVLNKLREFYVSHSFFLRSIKDIINDIESRKFVFRIISDLGFSKVVSNSRSESMFSFIVGFGVHLQEIHEIVFFSGCSSKSFDSLLFNLILSRHLQIID